MKKILVFCANRSETSYLIPVLRALDERKIMTRLLVTGTHLSGKYGNTIREFSKEGIKVHYKIRLDTDKDSSLSKTIMISKCIQETAKILNKVKPDIILLFGDRMEQLAAATAATYLSIPIGHIFGGDSFYSYHYDANVRHSITKLSHLHFAACEEHKNRILNLGEERWRVFNVGSPAAANVRKINTASKDEIERYLNIDLKKKTILFTQHSVPSQLEKTQFQIRQSIRAIKKLDRNIQIIITYPAHDVGADIIIRNIETLRKRENIRIIKSLGRYYYHGLLKYISLVAGNSSSGLLDTPIYKIPAVDIGQRESNRMRLENVITVNDFDEKKIYCAMKKALNNKPFLKVARNCHNPYGDGTAGLKIAGILGKQYNLEKLLTKK